MKIEISKELKSSLELQQKKTRDSSECDRIKAVLLRGEQLSIEKISQVLRIDTSTVSRHLRDFISIKKLKSKNAGSKSFLNAAQTKYLISHLTDVSYFHVHQICTYIKKICCNLLGCRAK